MKLIYDMRHLTGQTHGMARYATRLLEAMLRLEEDLGVGVLLHRQEHASQVPDDKRIVNIITGLAPYGPKAQWFLPGLLNKLALDVYHCPFYAPPAKFKGPMAFTVHDLIHLLADVIHRVGIQVNHHHPVALGRQPKGRCKRV